jgi:hypothetical protein
LAERERWWFKDSWEEVKKSENKVKFFRDVDVLLENSQLMK